MVVNSLGGEYLKLPVPTLHIFENGVTAHICLRKSSSLRQDA
jgi:hypothetical protein